MEEIRVSGDGALEWRGKRYACVLGRAGVVQEKREGDGGTPSGSMALRRLHYRPDRLDAPATGLPVRVLRPDDGWCDDPADGRYNRLVTLPYPARAERLWRPDRLYDVIVELGYNDDPVVPDRGSAIFLHVAGAEGAPTEGCVALALAPLLEIVGQCSAETVLRVVA